MQNKKPLGNYCFREALEDDIPQMHRVRNAVKENVLSDPSRITFEDYKKYLQEYGKGWICTKDDSIVGFAIVDLVKNNIWALFVDPLHESKGIGKVLHDNMLDWYFSNTGKTLWLSTSPGTRAENFYRKSGWICTGNYGENEIRFELTLASWKNRRKL